MLSCPWKSTASVPWIFQSFLLLAVSLRAQNQSWDRANCTEGVVSVFRGSCAVMVCNMTNNFSEITIKLTALGEETRTIFFKKPPGNFSKDGWQLRNLGGQALLMINEAQAIHAGQYSWKLYGHQPIFRNTFLNVSEPQDQEEATSQRHSVVSSSQGWDRANCTEGVVSVFRGSCAVMVCNMTNNFSEITIKLTALGEATRTIFYKKPPGNFSKDGWQLRNLGGQALLMINEAQAIHAGNYSWKLYGHQPIFRNTSLNVSGFFQTEPQDQEEATRERHSVVSSSQDLPVSNEIVENNVESPSDGGTGIAVVIVLLILRLTVVRYKCHHAKKLHQIRAFPPDLTHGSEPPCGAYLTLQCGTPVLLPQGLGFSTSSRKRASQTRNCL